MSRILLVDDEPGLCMLVSAELEDEGYTVTCAASLDAADELLAQSRVDLLILDIRLGKDNGLSLLHKLRSAPRRHLPVILFSAYGTYRHDRNTWQADAYVEKSSDLTRLKQAIAKLLARYHLPEGPR